MAATLATIETDNEGIKVGGGDHFSGRSGQSAYTSPSLIAIQRVIGDQPPDPRPAKQADATSISNESGENPLFVPDTEAPKSWSTEVPSASFLRSMASVGRSKDQQSVVDSSQSRTTASSVTVTRQDPCIPNGCQRAEDTAGRDVTW